nr:ORF6N domain-containing protein [Fibrobacter sp.]
MNKRNAVVQKSGSPAPERPQFSLIDEELLKSRIYTIRGLKVMLNADLAEIYGYSTSAFNQHVKNNIEKFDDDFRFQITPTEFAGLISKFLISSWGVTRKLPYAFTEHGIE